MTMATGATLALSLSSSPSLSHRCCSRFTAYPSSNFSSIHRFQVIRAIRDKTSQTPTTPSSSSSSSSSPEEVTKKYGLEAGLWKSNLPGSSMAISESTRGATEQRKMEEFFISMQQSWSSFQNEMKKQLIEQQNELKQQMADQQTRQEHVNGTLNELIAGLSRQVLQISTQFNEQGNHGHGNQTFNGGGGFSRLSKVDFPKFDGRDIQGWIYRCEQFFSIDDTIEAVKVKVASIHLEEKALMWHQTFMRSFGAGQWPTWEVYKEAISARFGKQPFDDPLAELMQLKQTGSVANYQDAFDTLLTRIDDLPVGHALSCFLSGLIPEIQSTVRMFKPKSLHDAYCLAKLQEATLFSISRRKPILDKPSFSNSLSPSNNSKPFFTTPTPSNSNLKTAFSLPSTKSPQIPYSSQNSNQASSSNFRSRKPGRALSAQELDERRSKSLCFYCDEKYMPGHKCKAQMYRIELLEEEECGKWEAEVDESGVNSSEILTEEEPHISLNALTGFNTFQTMRVTGRVGKSPIHILIDSGSTHNFLDSATARRLHCEVRKTVPLQVSVANGEKIESSAMCKDFSWLLHGEEFQADVMLVPLGSCEMILGVQWLSSLGQILWDFDQLRMEFQYKGRRVVIRGTRKAEIHWMQGRSMHDTLSQTPASQIFAIQVQPLEVELQSVTPQVSHPSLCQLLTEFEDVFAEPKTLPPHRGHDHMIELKEGTPPINVRPYRYPALQKDIIEQIVKEMLDSGVVKPSQSPFSSPIVLVKKKDGSWRMCVDYRELNKHTIKDKFPIPVIEELLDELHGSKYFSKIDLRSGYWQVRMRPQDTVKTAFRTHEGHYEFLVMPFGLTNAPSTFQALMNHVFKPYLRKFILVFFDDILVYSPTLDQHLAHLRITLGLLRTNTLFAKLSKCSFGDTQVEYLGHIISENGVATDPQKIQAMEQWPTPSTLKQLRGFLGLTGYYRKFIRGYGIVSKPLTDLLKKNAFYWDDKADLAFANLKQAMMSAPVLALPNFQEEFVIETDASGVGIGAVLMQQGHPIAYISKALATKHHGLSAYEKELLAVVYAVEKWKPYLIGRHFTIKTDHFSLKYLLEQKISTPFQSKLLPKLLGLDYDIIYKKGRENTAADSLSRFSSVQLMEFTISSIDTELLQKVKQSWDNDPEIQTKIAELAQQPQAPSKYTWAQGLLKKKGRLVVGQDNTLRQNLVKMVHTSPFGGHSGVHVTYQKLSSWFYWKGMKREVRNLVRCCEVCQRNKPILQSPAGLLQPLPIPGAVWVDISMDFIEGLPPSKGKTTIFVVVDRLSKYAHFIPLSHPFTAASVAQVYFEQIYKLHGLPRTITSDRDKIFLSTFWTELFTLQRVNLQMSTAYHPQTDGQTEVVNRCLEGYLRCMTGDKPKDWVLWLPLAEWWYNSNWHSAINTTPYEVVYGQPPSLHVPYVTGDSNVEAVDRSLSAREECVRILQFHLKRAQERMKLQADKQRVDQEFQIGDLVYVKLQPYRQSSVALRTCHKLAAKFFGPFPILARVGQVAYRLDLPPAARVHPVFHVSQLKKHIGKAPTQSSLPEIDEEGLIMAQPVAVLDRKLKKVGNKAVVYVLIQWSNSLPEEATWEPYTDIERRFPDFNLQA